MWGLDEGRGGGSGAIAAIIRDVEVLYPLL